MATRRWRRARCGGRSAWQSCARRMRRRAWQSAPSSPTPASRGWVGSGTRGACIRAGGPLAPPALAAHSLAAAGADPPLQVLGYWGQEHPPPEAAAKLRIAVASREVRLATAALRVRGRRSRSPVVRRRPARTPARRTAPAHWLAGVGGPHRAHPRLPAGEGGARRRGTRRGRGAGPARVHLCPRHQPPVAAHRPGSARGGGAAWGAANAAWGRA